ncbi:hypothetical protein ACCO45_005970 [Purpureocillium lilacinum]|uniref:Uncharacterized protein n=1 Tax=Purpureocillium lilacinum TaxID=33203 RepID=A0ACC4DXN5_PURLI
MKNRLAESPSIQAVPSSKAAAGPDVILGGIHFDLLPRSHPPGPLHPSLKLNPPPPEASRTDSSSTASRRPTQLSADSKGQRIAYASGKSVFVRSIDNPADCKDGDASGMLRVWEPESIESTRGEYGIISGRLNDIAWDGDSQRIIAVGDGKEQFGRCITADSGNSVGEIIGHSKSVNAVAMKAQRPFRAATVGDDANMVFYHGAPYKFNEKNSMHKGFVLGAAYSPDGNTLATVGADKRIQLYDGKTGQPTKQLGDGEHTGSIFALSWSQDGKKFATASADQTVKLWDADAGTVIQTWKFGDGVSVADQQVGVVIPHGRTDGLIISVSLRGELIYLNEGKTEPGSAVWTGSFDGRVCSWDVATGRAAVVDGEPHTNQVAQLTGNAGKIYSAGWDDTLKIVDESAKTFLGQSIKLSAQPKGASAGDKIVYVATVSGIAAYSNDAILKETSLSYTPGAIATSGSFVAVGADQNSVRIYKADPSGGLEQVQAIANPTGTISALAFSKDGSHLAAGNSVGKIYVYKTGSWETVADRCGSLDTNVFVWCLEKKNQGKRIKAANAHKDGVSGISWVEGGKVASAGGDATVKIWNVTNLP